MDKIKAITDYIIHDKYIKLLLVVLTIGAILRYYGIHNAENTDEYNEIMEALRVASGHFNYERWMKKGYQNILAIEFGIYFVMGYIANVFQGPMDFAAKIVRDMEPLFLIGRYTTSTMGIASIGVLYMIGRKVYNERVALIAALFLAVTTVHVWTSHLVNTDVPLTFFFLLSLYFIVRFYTSGKIVDYVVAAFLGAVTINIKLNGIGIGIIYILAHFFRCKKANREIKEYVFNKEILYATLAFFIGLIISNPPLLLGLKEFILYNYTIYANEYKEVPYAIGGNAYYTYTLLLLKEFGIPLFLLTLTSLGYGLYKREEWDYIFIVFVVGIFLILGGTSFLVQNRYLMTLLPVLYLLNARFLDTLIGKLGILAKKKTVTILIIGIAFSAIPLMDSIKYVRTLTQDNTSKMSKKWIEQHIPSGSKILLDAGHTIITSGPRLNQSKDNLEKKLNVIKNLKKGETYDSPMVKIVDSYSSIYFELLLKNIPDITYDITSTELGRAVNSIEYYRKNGFNYFIHNEGLDFRIKDPLWREKYPTSAKFYDSIDNQFELIKTFSPSPTRSGSTIKVYKIQ